MASGGSAVDDASDAGADAIAIDDGNSPTPSMANGAPGAPTGDGGVGSVAGGDVPVGVVIVTAVDDDGAPIAPNGGEMNGADDGDASPGDVPNDGRPIAPAAAALPRRDRRSGGAIADVSGRSMRNGTAADAGCV